VSVADWLSTFMETAKTLYDEDPETLRRVLAMEIHLAQTGSPEVEEAFLEPKLRESWRNAISITQARLSSRTMDWKEQALSAADHEKTVHNERVKLSANFYNSLAVWFGGAGAAGALVNTLMASGAHNFALTGEVSCGGIILASALRWLATREIGKLR
jgi:hypothetical protein